VGAVALPGLGALPGEAGAASVETGGLGVGPWFVYAEISDGGAVAGAFAPGALVVYEKGDLDLDGDVDRADFAAAARLHARRARAGDSAAAAAADLDRDGDVDPRDLQQLGRRIQDALRAERPGARRAR
jgi:hypothetical protein